MKLLSIEWFKGFVESLGWGAECFLRCFSLVVVGRSWEVWVPRWLIKIPFSSEGSLQIFVGLLIQNLSLVIFRPLHKWFSATAGDVAVFSRMLKISPEISDVLYRKVS